LKEFQLLFSSLIEVPSLEVSFDFFYFSASVKGAYLTLTIVLTSRVPSLFLSRHTNYYFPLLSSGITSLPPTANWPKTSLGNSLTAAPI